MRRWVSLGLALAAMAVLAWPAGSEPPPLVAPYDPEPLHTRMHAHFSALRDVHRALLFGDLRKARRLARDLSEMTAPGGLPGWESSVARIRETAGRLTRARSARRALRWRRRRSSPRPSATTAHATGRSTPRADGWPTSPRARASSRTRTPRPPRSPSSSRSAPAVTSSLADPARRGPRQGRRSARSGDLHLPDGDEAAVEARLRASDGSVSGWLAPDAWHPKSDDVMVVVDVLAYDD